MEYGFAMKIVLVDIEGVSERIGEARNLNQHFFITCVLEPKTELISLQKKQQVGEV